MVGGREADPWVFSCVSQFMVQVSLDPSAISSTALPALSQAATKITDVLTSQVLGPIGLFMFVPSIIFDPF